METKILEGEYWWGGCVVGSEKMPFHSETVFKIDLERERRTQSAPLFLSSKGRFIWCEEPFAIEFNRGTITASCEYDSPIILNEEGKNLRDAYINAMNAYFPFEKDIHTPREFYEHPQFNTWMELIKNQNEKDIIRYAEEVVENGYTPGILMIDGGWQKKQGVWDFNPELISDPKGMVDRLHELGFIVMIWVSPFICTEGDHFLSMYQPRATESGDEIRRDNHFVRVGNGDLCITKWWSGFSAIHNFMLPDDCAEMDAQLGRLMNEFGFDGFKFDGGSYLPNSFYNGTDIYGGYTFAQLSQAWVRYGSKYKYHEYKDTWKMGGYHTVQRLWDKRHNWKNNGLDCLIPNGIFTGLIGCPFICPDMVGGGEWTCAAYGTFQDELFVRMAQASALFPMMQFSAFPWRHLSPEASEICHNMARLHEKMFPVIEKFLTIAETTGEPMVRHLAYQFPDEGYETVNDMFMLGDEYLVAPVVEEGQREKTVRLPKGTKWVNDLGIEYEGGTSVTENVPLERLVYYKRIG